MWRFAVLLPTFTSKYEKFMFEKYKCISYLFSVSDIPIHEHLLAQQSSNSDQTETSRSVIKTTSENNRHNEASTSRHFAHSRTSSWDLRVSSSRHSRNPSTSLHSRNSSADLNKFVRNDLGFVFNSIQNNQKWIDPLRVQIIKAHHNWLAVAYSQFFLLLQNERFFGMETCLHISIHR